MLKLACFALLVCLAVGDPIPGDVCQGKPDGSIPVYGCKSFSMCKGGKSEIIDCTPGVFNKKEGKCDVVGNVEPPCGIVQDCTGKPDGRYVEMHEDYKCKAYYTCLGGKFLGHNPCPGGLVFNEVLGTCDYTYNVPPPCGTKQ